LATLEDTEYVDRPWTARLFVSLEEKRMMASHSRARGDAAHAEDGDGVRG